MTLTSRTLTSLAPLLVIRTCCTLITNDRLDLSPVPAASCKSKRQALKFCRINSLNRVAVLFGAKREKGVGGSKTTDILIGRRKVEKEGVIEWERERKGGRKRERETKKHYLILVIVVYLINASHSFRARLEFRGEEETLEGKSKEGCFKGVKCETCSVVHVYYRVSWWNWVIVRGEGRKGGRKGRGCREILEALRFFFLRFDAKWIFRAMSFSGRVIFYFFLVTK